METTEYLKEGVPASVVADLDAFIAKHGLRIGMDITILKRESGEHFIHLKRNGVRKILDKNGMTMMDTFFVYSGDVVVYKKGKIESITKNYTSDLILAMIGIMEVGKKYYCVELRSKDYYTGSDLWRKSPGVMLTRICEASLAKKAFPEIFEDIMTLDSIPDDQVAEDVDMSREEMISYIKENPELATEALDALSYDVAPVNLSAEKLKLVIKKMKEKE